MRSPRSQQPLAVMILMVLMVLTAVRGQENERRAVAEHQLVHDRGRSVQTLRRLIWLSSAIEGLHTAGDPDSRWRFRGPGGDSSDGHRRALETQWRDTPRETAPPPV